MRIIAGEWRGRPLETPADQAVRPTTDRVREALFSILTARLLAGPGHGFDGLRVLDLFAGTGALGFEALSRGAGMAVFVDKDRRSCRLIETNRDRLRAAARTHIIQADALRVGPDLGTDGFDLIFLDPPYRQKLVEQALAVIARHAWLRPGGLILAETAADEVFTLPPVFESADQRRYGETEIHLIIPKPA